MLKLKAQEIFKEKGIKIDGKVLACSKGGYRDDTFAFCISETEETFNVIVISAVNPREYQVEKSNALQDIYTAILYNEWKARTIHKRSISTGLPI